MSTELNSAPITEVSNVEAPDMDVADVEAIAESEAKDSEELEYQEAMRKIREGSAKDSDEEASNSEEPEEEAPAKEEKPSPKIKKFKVNKKEIEVDLSNEAEVESLIQKGLGAQDTFQEAAQMRKNAEAFVSALQKNPFEVLKHPSLGLDVRKLAEEYLWNEIQLEKMSPEEKAQIERDKKLKEYEEAERIKKETIQKQQDEARKAKQREYWTGLITTSLDKHQLPKIPWTIEETARRMQAALKNGYKDVTPDDIVPAVKEDFLAMRQSVLANMDEEGLAKFLGQDLVKKINKYEIKKFKDSKFQNKVSSKPQESTTSNRPYRNLEEMQRAVKNKYS